PTPRPGGGGAGGPGAGRGRLVAGGAGTGAVVVAARAAVVVVAAAGAALDAAAGTARWLDSLGHAAATSTATTQQMRTVRRNSTCQVRLAARGGPLCASSASTSCPTQICRPNTTDRHG